MKRRELAQERRTLGTTAGGSTYMVTLPKGWVEDLKLEKGEVLRLVQVDAGIYLCPAREREQPEARTLLKVEEELQGDALARALISLYVAGFDVIEVRGNIATEQREVVRHTAQRLIGAEILQETADFFLIHTLRDPQVLSVPQLLRYIRENVEGMLKDAPEALLERDLEKARGVIQRDERVDRFFLVLSRQLYAALQDPLAEVERDISRADFFNTHTVARQLERVADHAVKIAHAAQALIEEGRSLPSELAAGLAEAKDASQQLLVQVIRAFVDLDGEEAHRALAVLPQIERLVEEVDRRLQALDDSHLAYHLGIAVDSIGRVKDYAANIAEVALNAEALRR